MPAPPPTRMFANSTNPATKALQAGNASDSMHVPDVVDRLATTKFCDKQHPFCSLWYDIIPSSSPTTEAQRWAQRYGTCGSEGQEVLTHRARRELSQDASHRVRIRIMRCYRDPKESCSALNLRRISIYLIFHGTPHGTFNGTLICRRRRSSLSRRYNANCYHSMHRYSYGQRNAWLPPVPKCCSSICA